MASLSRTKPVSRLRLKRILLPSGEKRGCQSVASPFVSCLVSDPSVLIEKRCGRPARELVHTTRPFAFVPVALSASRSAGLTSFSMPSRGAAQPMSPEKSATGAMATTRRRSRRPGVMRNLEVDVDVMSRAIH